MPAKIDFYRLTRTVQERFAAVTRLTAPPLPLLFRRAPRTYAWACLGASAVIAVATTVLMRIGWGNAESALSLHGAKMLALDVALLAAAAWGVVHAMTVLRAIDSLPYKAGTYLFPACAVDARGPVLRVWRVIDADAVEVVASPPGVALRMRDGSRVVVPAATSDDAARAEAAIAKLRSELQRATSEDDHHVLAELDPLHDRALSSPIGPTEPMKRAVTAWMRFDWAIAAGVGVVLGLALGETRNAMSDDAMFRATVATGTIPAYRQYLDRGGRHSAQVRDELLPRAELRDVEARGSVEAMQEFARTHTSTKIQPEIDAAVRRAMLGELEKAKRAGTVAALDDFARNYPDHHLDAELKAARHTLFAAALAAWKKKSAPDSQTSAFMDRLFAWAEKSGPAVEVRFRTKPSRSLDDADKKVQKSRNYPGPDALPSHYFGVDALRAREKRVADAIVAAFAGAFPSDVIAARAADALAPDAATPDGAAQLVIEYSPEWSRSNTIATRPPTVFAGMTFAFDGVFSVPDGAPLKISKLVWRNADIWRLKFDGGSRTDYQQRVYDALIDGAFDQLQKKIVETLF